MENLLHTSTINTDNSFLPNYSVDLIPSQDEKLKLAQEIAQLESKVDEVNSILLKPTLANVVRFQLKEDLEYYQQLIQKKRELIQK